MLDTDAVIIPINMPRENYNNIRNPKTDNRAVMIVSLLISIVLITRILLGKVK